MSTLKHFLAASAKICVLFSSIVCLELKGGVVLDISDYRHSQCDPLAG